MAGRKTLREEAFFQPGSRAAWIGWCEGLHQLRAITAALRIGSSGRISTLVRECERLLDGNAVLQARLAAACAGLD